jgi:hypothetical protein
VAGLQDDVSRLEAAGAKTADALTEIKTRLGAQEARSEEWRKQSEVRAERYEKQFEESERRRWQMLIMLILALVTVIANVLLTLVRR